MWVGILLEELIGLAHVPKTDFALSMNMTPSGLSKILTGRRVPPLVEKKVFSRQAAQFFAETIYSRSCHQKLSTIFPITYDFSSKYELAMFLEQAISYALDKDYAKTNEEVLESSHEALSYRGKKTVLNMFCIIVSDYLKATETATLEFYSTLPLFSHEYSDLVKRLKVVLSQEQNSSVMNHYFSINELELACSDRCVDVLATLFAIHKSIDCTLWQADWATEYLFLFLKGQFLLMINRQMDGTPFMTLVTHKSSLAAFFTFLTSKEAKKISYSRDEAADMFENDPQVLDGMLDSRNVPVIYNFLPLGYLVHEDELSAIKYSQKLKTAMLQLFETILNRKLSFIVTLDVMRGFFTTGKVIIPLIGIIGYSSEERAPYLRRLNALMDEQVLDNFRVVNIEMPDMVALSSGDRCLVYFYNEVNSFEKIHIFRTEALGVVLKKNTAASMKMSIDLWEAFIEEQPKS